jgi:hypothetical protein
MVWVVVDNGESSSVASLGEAIEEDFRWEAQGVILDLVHLAYFGEAPISCIVAKYLSPSC